jgi:polyisoprenoid-binding protein YceI
VSRVDGENKVSEVSSAAERPAQLVADLYVIDGRASRFAVRTFASGFLAAMGHNPTIAIRDFSGGMNFSPERGEANSFLLLVKTSSLSVQDDISTKDRREIERVMHREVLETEKFPEIRYEADGIALTKMSDMLYSASLNGDLTLHGVTRSQPVSARVALLGSMLRASGDFSLNQTDYKIRPVSFAGGALKLKDELKFSFEIVARKQG